MRKAPIISVLLLLHGLAGVAFGQEKYGIEFGGYAAWTKWNERDFTIGAPQSVPPIDLQFAYKDRPAGGIRLNLLSRNHWGGELSYSYQQNTARITRESVTPVELKGGVHHFFFNEVFYPWRYHNSGFTPFVTAGIGLAAYHLNDEARARAADPSDYGIGNLISMDKRFAFNYGGGVKQTLSATWGVRADFRHIFSDVPSFGLPKESSDPSQTVLPIQGKLTTYEFSVGFYYQTLK